MKIKFIIRLRQQIIMDISKDDFQKYLDEVGLTLEKFCEYYRAWTREDLAKIFNNRKDVGVSNVDIEF